MAAASVNWERGGWRAALQKGIYLEVLVGSRLSASQQCALAARRANRMLGCVTHSMTCQLAEAIVLL